MSTSNVQRERNHAHRRKRRALLFQQANMVKAEALSRREKGIQEIEIWRVYEGLKKEARR